MKIETQIFLAGVLVWVSSFVFFVSIFYYYRRKRKHEDSSIKKSKNNGIKKRKAISKANKNNYNGENASGIAGKSKIKEDDGQDEQVEMGRKKAHKGKTHKKVVSSYSTSIYSSAASRSMLFSNLKGERRKVSKIEEEEEEKSKRNIIDSSTTSSSSSDEEEEENENGKSNSSLPNNPPPPVLFWIAASTLLSLVAMTLFALFFYHLSSSRFFAKFASQASLPVFGGSIPPQSFVRETSSSSASPAAAVAAVAAAGEDGRNAANMRNFVLVLGAIACLFLSLILICGSLVPQAL